MTNIGILYSTVDGQTKKICEFLAAQLKHKNQKVSLYSVTHFQEEVSIFDTLVIGANIRYGKHSDKVTKFISENQEELEKINTAFFSVNLVARKADKNQADSNPYVIKFMNSINWKPDLVDVFAGSLDYSRYGFFDRLMIKAIMRFTNGPTTTKEPIEYTDWERVSNFGEKVLKLGRLVKPESRKEILT